MCCNFASHKRFKGLDVDELEEDEDWAYSEEETEETEDEETEDEMVNQEQASKSKHFSVLYIY